MNNKNMKILLTGGEGFIGSSFVKKFYKEFDFVIISSKKNDFKKIAKTEYLSITNKKIIKTIENLNPDIVIHLAGLSGLKKCETEPEKAFDVNVNGTTNVIKGCLKINAKLIFISTREVYGSTINKESNENDSLNPINIYGKTKMEAEKIIQNTAKNSKLNYIILRLTNVYGPGTNSGVNYMIKESLNEGKISVNGGEQVLNFIFIEDVIELIHLVILNSKLFRQIFNIGSKDTISLKKFVEILIGLLNNKVDVEFVKKPNFESLFFRPNIKKQQNILAYNSKISLKEGINKTLQYMKINL
jgi:UDP-glucose 4-epimerase